MTIRRPPLPHVTSPKLGNVRFAQRAVGSANPPVGVEDGALVLRPSSSVDEARFERARVLLSSALYAGEAPSSTPTGRRGSALEKLGPVPIEKSEPVGTNAYYNTNDFQANYNAISSGRAAPDPSKLTFDDAGVSRLMQTFFSHQLSAGYLGNTQTVSPDAVAMFRNFVRAAELGTRVNVESAVWQKTWPVDVATASLLRRAAKAFRVDETAIAYAGATLADYQVPLSGRSRRQNAASERLEQVPIEPAREVGKAIFTSTTDFDANWSTISSDRPAADPSRVTFNDATVGQLISNYFGNSLEPYHLGNATTVQPDAVKLFRNFVRARELGSQVVVSPSIWSSKTWPVNPETASLLRRAARAFGVAETSISYDGSTLADYKAPPRTRGGGSTRPERLEQVPIEPAGPVGTATYTSTNDVAANWGTISNDQPAADPTRLTFNDATVQRAITEYFGTTLSSDRVGRKRDVLPDAVEFLRNFVRAAELGTPITISSDFWSSKTWPVDPKTAALLRRAAQAFGVAETSIPYAGSTLAEFRVPASRRGTASFGTSSLDIEQSLLNLYPSLGVAKLLGENDALAGGVAAFVDSLELPEEILPFVENAIGQGLSGTASSSGGDTTPRSVQEIPWVERSRGNADGEYQGFAVATGPIATTSSMDGYTYSQAHNNDPVSFFRTAATDENILNHQVQGYTGWDLNGWQTYLRSGGATPADVVNFTARRLETYSSAASWMPQTKSTLLNGTASHIFLTDECVPALLRLAKVCEVDLNAVRLANGKTLRERATELKLFSKKETKSELLPSSPLSSEMGGTTAERLDGLTAFTGRGEDALSFGELVAHLTDLSSKGELVRFEWPSLDDSQREQLLDAVTADQHPGAAAVLAGLLVPSMPADAQEALRERLDGFWQYSWGGDAGTWVENAARLSRLDDPARTWVVEGLDETPPDFALLPLRLDLAERKTLTLPRVQELFGEWQFQDPAGALRTIVEFANLGDDRRVNAVRKFLEQGLDEGTLNVADVHHAMSEGRGRLFIEDAMAKVHGAMAQVQSADVVTRDAAVAALIDGVEAVSRLVPPDEVVSLALRHLYEADLEHIAPLSEVESRLGTVKPEPFVDPTPIVERVGASRSTANFEGLAVQNPRLAHEVELIKTRLLLGLDESAALELPARAEQAASALFDRHPKLDDPTRETILAHLKSWVVDQQLQFDPAT